MEATAALIECPQPVVLIRLTGGELINAADILYIRRGDHGDGSHVELRSCNRDFVDDRDPDELGEDIANLMLSVPSSRALGPEWGDEVDELRAEASLAEARLEAARYR